MTDQDLEFLSEALSDEIGELEELLNEKNISVEFKNKLTAAVSNLRSINNRIYKFFEELPEGDVGEPDEALRNATHEVMNNLPWSEKIYLRIRHGIDL